MKTIRDTELFEELKKSPLWGTLFEDNLEGKNVEIPVLAGGLDHIDVKKKGVYFHDIGCNGRDNSFVVRPELEELSYPSDIRDLKVIAFAERGGSGVISFGFEQNGEQKYAKFSYPLIEVMINFAINGQSWRGKMKLVYCTKEEAEDLNK